MAASFATGDVVCGGRFRIVRVIGAGGMGSVYEVVDTSIERTFVLKTLHGELASDADLRRQMMREARVLGRIDHLNVVRVFTAGVSDDELALPFIVMEKLEGASLREVLRAKTRIPFRAAVRAVVDLLLALDHIHELGVVHCDLKPENLFLHVERDGSVTPKLLDFGVVRVLPRGEASARLGGTLRYASPEHVRGEPVGPRSDVYSMGLVLYEMLAGRSAFHDATGIGQITRAQLVRTPLPIAGVPSGLMSIISRAVSKDPSMRQRDAFSFARELKEIESFLGGEKNLDATVVATRARCDEITSSAQLSPRRDSLACPSERLTTRARDEHDEVAIASADTEPDESSWVSNRDLLTRYAAGCDEGGGGRCDGFFP